MKQFKVVKAWIVYQEGINILASEVSFYDSATNAKACCRVCGDHFKVMKVKITPIRPPKKGKRKP